MGGCFQNIGGPDGSETWLTIVGLLGYENKRYDERIGKVSLCVRLVVAAQVKRLRALEVRTARTSRVTRARDED